MTRREPFTLALGDHTNCAFALVDEIDWHHLIAWRWFLTPSLYAARTVGTGHAARQVWAHRVVCERALGPAPRPGLVVDHRNGDRLDNRRANLRWLTTAENNRYKPTLGHGRQLGLDV